MTLAPTRLAPFSTGEVTEITETSAMQIEFWCRAGLLLAQQSGHRFPRRFPDDEVLVVIMIRELTRAGLSVPQLQQAITALRAKIAATPAAWRRCALLHDYIGIVKMLARTFGEGDGYDRWLTDATALLKRMKRETQAREQRRTRAGAAHDDTDDDTGVRDLLVATSRLPDSGLSVRAPRG